MPYSATEGSRHFLDTIGTYALTIPTSDGPRARWVIPTIQAMAHDPSLVTVIPGSLGPGLNLPGNIWPYLTLPRYLIKPGCNFVPSLGIVDHTVATWQRLLSERGREEVGRQPLQVDVPDPMQVPIFSGSRGMYPIFVDETVRAIWELHRRIVEAEKGKLVYQFDIPAQTSMVNLPLVSDATARRLITRFAAMIGSYLERLPRGSNVAFHLCYGHKDRRSLVSPKSLGRTVALANAVAAAVPGSVRLDFMHLPMATPGRPPTLDRRYYEALGGLQIGDAALAAGFVHPLVTPGGLVAVRDMVGARWKGELAVSTSCGLGEDTRKVATAMMGRLRELAVA